MKKQLFIVVASAVISLTIVSILGFTHAFAPMDAEKRSFPDFMHAQWPKWIGCAMATHENLAGGLLGAAGTIFAAYIAWSAVQAQIMAERELVQEPHIRIMRAVKNILKPLIECFDVFISILDETRSFQGSDEEKMSRTTWLQSCLPGFPPETIIDELEKLLPSVPHDRAKALEGLIARARNLYVSLNRFREQPERADELKWRLSDVRMIRLQVELFRDAVRSFEPAWVKYFGEHPVVPLDPTTFAQLWQEMRRDWLTEEECRRNQQ
jgi:hypothetical protein